MNACIYLLRTGLVSLALIGTISGATSAGAQFSTSKTPVTSRARTLAIWRSAALSTTPSSLAVAR
jgi:hypothetical protein